MHSCQQQSALATALATLVVAALLKHTGQSTTGTAQLSSYHLIQ